MYWKNIEIICYIQNELDWTLRSRRVKIAMVGFFKLFSFLKFKNKSKSQNDLKKDGQVALFFFALCVSLVLQNFYLICLYTYSILCIVYFICLLFLHCLFVLCTFFCIVCFTCFILFWRRGIFRRSLIF